MQLQKLFLSLDDRCPPVAVLHQAEPPPVIRSIRKPMKPGGYKDSGADIAYALQTLGVPLITPNRDPAPNCDEGWTFPDTREGICDAIGRGVEILWTNTVLYNGHPVADALDQGVSIVGHDPVSVDLFDDKRYTNELLRQNGCPVPKAISVGQSAASGVFCLNDLTSERLAENGIRFPAVIKPIRGRGSEGVEKVDNIDALKAGVSRLLAEKICVNGTYYSRFGNEVMVEEYLPFEEFSVSVMPPGVYRIAGQRAHRETHWPMPPVVRFGHENGIAPYSGVVAVVRNSACIDSERMNDPEIMQLLEHCENAASRVAALAPIRIDCRCGANKQPMLFDLNMKPNMTGAGRLGREDQAGLVTMAATAIGWTYPELVWNVLHQAISKAK